MDAISQAFSSFRWSYAEGDIKALTELEARIAAKGRAQDLIIYSDLVEGVAFDLANLRDTPHVIDIHAWTDLDRALVGDFLGHISERSYARGGFFASALVVDKYDQQPGEGFYRLLRDLGLIARSSGEEGYFVWVEHVKKAHEWFRLHR